MSDLAATGRNVSPQAAFRVLVVDDDPDMAALLAATVQAEGMHAEVVSDGRAALASVTDAPPDLVLLDVVLPGACGFEICRRLKADPLTALIPVVLVTALEDRSSRLQGIEAGADDFLSKPVRPEELVARMKTLRRLHETRRELEARRLDAEVERKDALHKALGGTCRRGSRSASSARPAGARPSGPTPSAPTWWCCSQTCAASRGSRRRSGCTTSSTC